jgi:hypothetical protein
MSPGTLAILGVVVLASSIIGAITGGMSLVNVPVMMLLGMGPRESVATNMFALTFMSLSAALRFRKEKLVDWTLAAKLCAITLVTSAIGARLTVLVSERAVKATVAASMLCLLLFMLVRRGELGGEASETTPARRVIAWVVVAILGVYGGLYSGGYTTLLTFACVVGFGVPLLSAVALTKVVNVVSCASAAVVYAQAGTIDYRVGLPLVGVTLVGGFVGAHLAVKKGTRFVRVLFMLMVAALAVKLGIDLFSAR